MTTTTGGSVDFDYLSSVVANDAALVDEVLGIFEQQAEVWRPRLLDQADGWREVAHSIKGASRGIGARALGDACEAAEIKGDGELSGMRAALTAALADIRAYRSARRA